MKARATEYLRLRNIVASDKKDLLIGFDDGSKVLLTDIMCGFAKKENQRLRDELERLQNEIN